MLYCYGNGNGNGYVYVYIWIQHYDSCEIYGDINGSEENVMILFIDEGGYIENYKQGGKDGY